MKVDRHAGSLRKVFEAAVADVDRVRRELAADRRAALTGWRDGGPIRPTALSAIVLAAGFLLLYVVARLYGGPAWLEAPLKYLLIDQDHSVPEWLEYAAILVSAVALMAVARRRDDAFLRLLGLLYLWILAENALRLHETIAGYMGFVYKFNAELVYFAVTGALFSTILLVAMARRRFRLPALGYANLLAIGSLVLFAVVMDYVHARVGHHDRLLDVALGAAEDGGEMMVLLLVATWNALVHRSR